MDDSSRDAYSLRAQAEHWQSLVARQQELALRLSQLAREQRELSNLWYESGVERLGSQARHIEETLRSVETTVLQLEEDAVDILSRVLLDTSKQLRSE